MSTVIRVASISSTGKSRNGVCDTMFAVHTSIGDESREWLIPLSHSTMNQAALLGVKFGVMSVPEQYRDGAVFVADNPYLAKVFEKRAGEWMLAPESNKEAVDEVRKMFESVPNATLSLYNAKGQQKDEVMDSLRKKIRQLSKARLGVR